MWGGMGGEGLPDQGRVECGEGWGREGLPDQGRVECGEG